ncbi:hypothetical protein [Chitinophaga cymbidii]|uniref:Uncharacterized protein n=1 Tax=Chitinophaga cymbidii TaxID=1096750 RepID=A0A512RND9_9BACT|nr:hypothetical protein [Chitinophaga cymbidii]GEP97214.1 hypothetical protein CCY01nite_34740 [Chitinophaga cymbidii]
MTYYTEISFGKRLRIIFLLVLSLFSTASPILPDRIEPGNRQLLKSLVYENDNHEVGKTGFELTAARKYSNKARQQGPGAFVLQTTSFGKPAARFEWLRPVYYIFLHRLTPF